MNRLSRRSLILAGASAVVAAPAFALKWPSKPIRLVVAYGAGSPPDTFARIFGEFIGKEIGGIIVVDNKAGASGNLGSSEVARAAGDGYTLLYNVSSAFTVNPYLYTKMPFNAAKDLVPVGTTINQGYVIVANNSFPAKNFAELLRLAKEKPNQFSYASWGVGSYSHLLMEIILEKSGGKMLHVPYRASPLNEVVGGQVDILVEPMASAYQFISSGKVKALAFTADQRHPVLPDLPTVAESMPGTTLYAWQGIWAPASTSPEIVAQLSRALSKAGRDPQTVQKIKALQIDPYSISPDDMRRQIEKEGAEYARVIKQKNIQLD